METVMTELQEKIVELKKQGLKTRVIAKELNSSMDYVRETWRRYQKGDEFIAHKNQYFEIHNNQDYWKERFDSRYPAFEFIYNDGGIEGYNYIQCRYCGYLFKWNAQCLKPSHKDKIICKSCNQIIKQREKRIKDIRYKEYLAQFQFRDHTKYRQLRMDVCKVCGQLFTKVHNNQAYCSKTCASYLHWKGKEAYRYKVDLKIIYNRDKGICHICGRKCDWDDYKINENGYVVYGNDYPTRDHLVPKSKGGEHSYQNIALAHLRCNSLKGNTI